MSVSTQQRSGSSQHPEFGVPVGSEDYGSTQPSDYQRPEATDVPPSQGLRLMAVHAHPDDESSKGAAMMAAYEDAGADVMVALCTSGEAGSLLNQHYQGDVARLHRDMTAVRRVEMEESSQALGIDYRWLGFIDSGLPEGDPVPELPYGVFANSDRDTQVAVLVRLIREFRPHVLISYDEIGGYPHPDHLRAHEITVKAYQSSGDPQAYPGTGQAWEVSKLYYDRAFNPDKYFALHKAYEASGQTSPYADRIQWYEWLQSGEDPDAWRLTKHQVTTQIPVGNYLDRRDAALRAHATQIDPHGFFFTPHDIVRDAWPWEDYVLIDSRVPTHLPETDLFSGLRTPTPDQADQGNEA